MAESDGVRALGDGYNWFQNKRAFVRTGIALLLVLVRWGEMKFSSGQKSMVDYAYDCADKFMERLDADLQLQSANAGNALPTEEP